MLECAVNDSKYHYLFLIDSGADRTVIPFELASHLNLFTNFTKKDFTNGVEGKQIICYFYKIKSLLILHENKPFHEFKDVEIQVPLSNLRIPIFGRDLFKKFDITFRERRKEVILEK